MKAVELFAGIGGFRIATNERGIETIWANDNNPKACRVYRDRFGDKDLHEGNVEALYHQIPPHDLLTGGFPCQPFSSAGKKEGVRDARGTLFNVIVEALRSRQPEHFILENVKRLLAMEQGFHFATILSSLAELNYQIEWRLLNAMHFGLPQNRQRVVIIGSRQSGASIPIRLAVDADFAGVKSSKIEQLRDFERWSLIAKHGMRFPKWGVAQRGRFFALDLPRFSLATEVVPLCTVLESQVSTEFDFTETTLKWIEQNTPVNRFVDGVEIISNQGGGARMGYTIFGTNGVAPTLTSTTSRHYERYLVDGLYRRLTNVEYARIQGFPDNHCQAVSVYDQYALYGNAVPPSMVAAILGRILIRESWFDAQDRWS